MDLDWTGSFQLDPFHTLTGSRSTGRKPSSLRRVYEAVGKVYEAVGLMGVGLAGVGLPGVGLAGLSRTSHGHAASKGPHLS